MKLKNRITKYLLALTLIITLVLTTNIKLSAKELNLNGTYEAPIKLGLKMGADAFSDKVIIEKDNDNYYLTFTQVDSSNLANMEIHLGGNTGVIIRENGKEKIFTYTVTYEDLTKPIKFSVVVTVMNKYVEFNMDINLSKAKYLGDSIEDLGERPALFVPIIKTNASDSEFEHLSTYVIPDAKATLKNVELKTTYKVYYVRNGKQEEVETLDGKLKFNELGEYHLVYEAESDLYKTSLGNNTKATIDIKLISKVGATSLGKIEASANALPEGYMFQTTLIKTGEIYDGVKQKMAKIADNYQIFNVEIYSEDGSEIKPTEEVLLYLMADESYNRKLVKCYHLEADGSYTKINLDNYGRYVRLKTIDTGNYIIYVPGVAFVMPIWGYVLIGIGALLILAGAITTPIVIHFKRKKKALN